MSTLTTILQALDEALNLSGAALKFAVDTKLAGAIPQLDSMAIVALVDLLEERLGIAFPEEQLDGSLFETVGTLLSFIENLKR